MRRVVAGFVSAAVVATALISHSPANAAEPLPAPELTSPSVEEEVGATVELAATSGSAFVVFELVDRSDTRIVRRAPVAAGDDGVFRDTLPAAGFPSVFLVRARACSESRIESCTTTSPSVPMQRVTPRLVPTTPWPSVLDPSVQTRVSLRATDLGGSPATVRGTGLSPRQVVEGEVVTIDLSALSHATLETWTRQCSPLDASVCWDNRFQHLVRRVPSLRIGLPPCTPTLFLSQNGDGAWETTTSHVTPDPEVPTKTSWSIISAEGVTVAGPYEFTGDEVTIDPRARLGHALPGGTYRFVVTATATAPGFTKSNRASLPLIVSNARKITALPAPATNVFYPSASASDVPQVLRLDAKLDPLELRYGGFGYTILDKSGRALESKVSAGQGQYSIRAIDPAHPVITWDGYYEDERLHKLVPAPEGTYRIQLIQRARQCPVDVAYGPVSPPFTLSRRERGAVAAQHVTSARSSRLRTLAKQGARVRARAGGALSYQPRTASKGVRRVTTLHSVRVPRNRLDWVDTQVRLTGAWTRQHRGIEVRIVTPRGRVLRLGNDVKARRNSLELRVRESWLRADGRLRFQVRWSGKRSVRLDKVIVRYTHNAWIS